MIKVIATEIRAKDLQPGDLFTIAPQEYWDSAMDHRGVGEQVYIRTNMSADIADDTDRLVYKVVIEKE